VKVIRTEIPEVLILEPKVFGDERGFFFESYNKRSFRDATGLEAEFVQDNHSSSRRGVLRGLHYQIRQAQGKLVRVISGEVFDVAVDLRRGSPTFGHWEGFQLDDERAHQLYIPVGFGHGFCVTSEVADFVYKCTNYYDPATESGFRFDDPEVGIEWPDVELLYSERDRSAPRLAEIADELPFRA
jgi:dTDP-4-dehydrorhamnose 3,5-epimerase